MWKFIEWKLEIGRWKMEDRRDVKYHKVEKGQTMGQITNKNGM